MRFKDTIGLLYDTRDSIMHDPVYERRMVDAYIVGELAVHTAHTGKGYTISHTRAGIRMISYVASLSIARYLMDQLNTRIPDILARVDDRGCLATDDIRAFVAIYHELVGLRYTPKQVRL